MNSWNIYKDFGEPYIFISYAHTDSERVGRVLSVLQKNNYRFWYDEGIRSGIEWADELVKRIKNCHSMLLFLSKSAVESKGVKNELVIAERKNKPINVVMLEDVELEGFFEYFLTGQQQCVRLNASDQVNFEQKLCNILGSEAKYVIEKEVHLGNIQNDFKSRYQFLRSLSRGVLCETFLALQYSTNSHVIVKRAVKDGISQNKNYFKGLEREARVLSVAQCPYVPIIIDYIEDDMYKYLIESKIYGENLEDFCEHYKLKEEECVEIIIKLAKILRRFSEGEEIFVHKDLKPANVMVDKYGEVYLIDFSGSKFMKRGERQPDEVIVGTLGFAAYEQINATSSFPNGTHKLVCTDIRTDIYALGKILYYLLMSPYLEKNRLIHFIKNEPIRTIRYFNPEYHPKLDVIMNRMTGDLPEWRYQTLDEVIDALMAYKNMSIYEEERLIKETDKEICALKNSEEMKRTNNTILKPMQIPAPVKFPATEINPLFQKVLLADDEDDFRTTLF